MCKRFAEPTLDDLERIRTRKAEAPVLTVDLKNGKQEKVWCTFSPQQIDIDVTSKQGMQPHLPASLTEAPDHAYTLKPAPVVVCFVFLLLFFMGHAKVSHMRV